MAVRIVEGSVRDHRDLLQPLLEQHVEEITTRKDLMVLAPDWPRYESAEDAGALFMLYAWVDDQLAGYSCNFIGQHLHYMGLRYAHNDVLFLAKPYRAGRAGAALIAATENVARSRGAKVISWHSKPDTALHALLPRIGCKVQDVIWMKEL